MSNAIDAALASPVSPAISDAVWEAYEKQKSERLSKQPATVRGILKVTGSLGGMVFTPLEVEDGDKIYGRVDMDKLYAGLEVTITI